jgi:hypothetical protein
MTDKKSFMTFGTRPEHHPQAGQDWREGFGKSGRNYQRKKGKIFQRQGPML